MEEGPGGGEEGGMQEIDTLLLSRQNLGKAPCPLCLETSRNFPEGNKCGRPSSYRVTHLYVHVGVLIKGHKNKCLKGEFF